MYCNLKLPACRNPELDMGGEGGGGGGGLGNIEGSGGAGADVEMLGG